MINSSDSKQGRAVALQINSPPPAPHKLNSPRTQVGSHDQLQVSVRGVSCAWGGGAHNTYVT